MIRNRLATLSLDQVRFIGSCLAPYLLRLLVPRSISLVPQLLDLLALVVLIITAGRLFAGTAQTNRNGLLYPILGLAAVVGYFYSENTLQQAGDYMGFVLRKPSLEVELAQRTRQSSRDGLWSYPSGVVDGWAGAGPTAIIYYTLDGEASNQFWGYAYSPEDRKPTRSNLTYWHPLQGHWFMWVRPD